MQKETARENRPVARSKQPKMVWNFMPFKGIRYSREKVGDISRVVAPPYDVISPEQRDEFCRQHECNVVHLTLGREQEGDDDRENKYTRAGRAFREWAAQGALVEDRQPAFYVYDQEFELGGRTLARRAFFTALRLEPFGRRVLPHEETMPGPRADRLRLITACPVNLSPIFGLYPDADGTMAALLNMAVPPKPDISFTDFAGIKQTLWKVDDPRVAAMLSLRMEDKPVYIADGHHRYETALKYRDMAIEADGGLDPADPRNFIMTACVSISDPGLVVLPAHRVIGGVSGFAAESLLEKLSADFSVSAFSRAGGVEALLAEMAGRQHVFGLYAGGRMHVLALKDASIAHANPAGRSNAWKRLDVSILLWLILERGLGLAHEDLSNPQRVKYVKDAAEAAQLVDGGQYQAVCFLNPTRVNELEQVAQAGERMPPKSTYFYPKLLTGLVMRKLI